MTINGERYQRWQYKITGGGRIWYAMLRSTKYAGTVVLEVVSPSHPDEAVKNHR